MRIAGPRRETAGRSWFVELSGAHTRPDDLSDHAVAEAVRRGWGIRVDAIEYAAVGFGSHHWHIATSADRWFVTVDDLDKRLVSATDSRSASARSARRCIVHGALAADHRLRVRRRSEAERVRPGSSNRSTTGYVLAVYPHVEGATGSFGPFANRAERLDIVELLTRLHAVDIPVPARATDFTIPGRERLHEAMAQTSGPWFAGPFAEPTRELLARHQGSLPATRSPRTTNSCTQCVRRERALSSAMGNRIGATSSSPPVDPCSSTGIPRSWLPPERDFWSLIDEDPEVRPHYERTTGTPARRRRASGPAACGGTSAR